jgi:elongation factor P
MDQEDYEQITFSSSQLESVKDYLKENEIYEVIFFEGKPISVEAPTFMILTVKETVPGVRGNTAQGSASKPATLETGKVIQVPLFVNEGDKIKVDTREDKYIERT